MMNSDLLFQILIFAPPLLLAITLHEASHGYVAKRFGDRTAELQGRLTLNPLKHVDPVGTVLVPLAMLFLSRAALGYPMVFGWAKPVPVDMRNLGNPRRDMALVAAAGPASNIAMAIGWGLLIKLLMTASPFGADTTRSLIHMAQFGIHINAILAVLNMLPILPLDGGRVAYSLLPPRIAHRFGRLEPYGLFIVIGLLVTGLLWPIMLPGLRAVWWLVMTLVGIG